MNKGEFIDKLSHRLGGDKKASTAAVDAVVSEIESAVSSGDTVNISGFGVFEKRDRAARNVRNPQTGEPMNVKKTSVPAFRAGNTFKGMVAPSGNGSRNQPQARQSRPQQSQARTQQSQARTQQSQARNQRSQPAAQSRTTTTRVSANRSGPQAQSQPRAQARSQSQPQGQHRQQRGQQSSYGQKSSYGGQKSSYGGQSSYAKSGSKQSARMVVK